MIVRIDPEEAGHTTGLPDDEAMRENNDPNFVELTADFLRLFLNNTCTNYYSLVVEKNKYISMITQKIGTRQNSPIYM